MRVLRNEYPFRGEVTAPLRVIPTCADLATFRPDAPPSEELKRELEGHRELLSLGSMGDCPEVQASAGAVALIVRGLERTVLQAKGGRFRAPEQSKNAEKQGRTMAERGLQNLAVSWRGAPLLKPPS